MHDDERQPYLDQLRSKGGVPIHMDQHQDAPCPACGREHWWRRAPAQPAQTPKAIQRESETHPWTCGGCHPPEVAQARFVEWKAPG